MGAPAGLAVLARKQTRARGSRGRSWIEPPGGNLALSVLLRPDADRLAPALWPFIAALALQQALSGTEAANDRLRLKWPNDVMLDGRKLGGILVERGQGGGHDWLVIGFGANLAAAPDLADRAAACMADLGAPAAPEEVAARLLVSFDGWCAVWQRDGFDAIKAAWLARAHPVGTLLAVTVHGVRQAGLFVGLDAGGALILGGNDGERRIDTGEILMLVGS